MKAVIYARVSSREQEETGYSLPSQEKLLKEYAQRKELHIVKVFSIAESSSGTKQRKIFDEMMLFMKKNNINILLCEKVDRLTRNLKDAVIANDWIDELPDRQIHFVKNNLIMHKNSKSDEKFRWDIEIVIARKYINNLSEEVKKGQKEKIAQGQLPTKPPLGYESKGEKGHKVHKQTSDAGLLRRMFEMYATGNSSLSRLEIEMYNLGLRTRSGKRLMGNRIHSLLTDPFYYGKMRWNGVIYDASHEAIISKDLFDKVQVNLKRQMNKPYLTKHNSIFKGKIRCEHCNGTLTWETQKGHWYGHCHNHGISRKCSKKTYIREELVEEQILDYFAQIAPKSHGMLSWIEGVIKSEFEEDNKTREVETARLNTLLAKVRQSKDKYYEAKIDQTVPLDFCDRKIDECLEEEESLKTALANVSEQSDSYKELRIAMHRLAFYAREIYQQASVDDKRLLLSQIFTNLTQDGYKIKPKFTLAAEYLTNWMPKLNQDYELDKMFTAQEKTGDLTPVSPIGLRG